MPVTQPALNWQSIDTVLLDVDGTLLDLHYDNFVWDQLIPEAYANLKQLPLPDAKQQLMEQMRLVHGTIDFYSFDFWSEQTGLDITGLHQQESQRIRYRADAEAFLDWLAQSAHDAIIATNADHNSLGIKEHVMALSQRVDQVFSSQDFGRPKEEQGFWTQLQQTCGFDPKRTLFLDDTERVLNAAAEFGIDQVWHIRTPDSKRGPRPQSAYPSIDHFHEIYPTA
ncbi:MAG: GMP/IMP nucleotidase [Proteobacteria bacterium]|nr:GMP/IMP nucleotidase [Pseudomonadota bacterium]